MNYPELRLRNFLCHKYTVIAKHTNAVANTQNPGEFPELYGTSRKICMERRADLYNFRGFKLFSSPRHPQLTRNSPRKPPISSCSPHAPVQHRRQRRADGPNSKFFRHPRLRHCGYVSPPRKNILGLVRASATRRVAVVARGQQTVAELVLRNMRIECVQSTVTLHLAAPRRSPRFHSAFR